MKPEDVADEDIEILWEEQHAARAMPPALPTAPGDREEPTQEIPPELLPSLVMASTLEQPRALRGTKASLRTLPPKEFRLPLAQSALPTREIPAAVLAPLVEATRKESGPRNA
ncbi:MAG: hypothetical protein JWM74_423 [Myxococcaceae bacterium]|jgi:hypothetical protein|nr:hypothetical protein [Myxococcaceae bacterium]